MRVRPCTAVFSAARRCSLYGYGSSASTLSAKLRFKPQHLHRIKCSNPFLASYMYMCGWVKGSWWGNRYTNLMATKPKPCPAGPNPAKRNSTALPSQTVPFSLCPFLPFSARIDLTACNEVKMKDGGWWVRGLTDRWGHSNGKVWVGRTPNSECSTSKISGPRWNNVADTMVLLLLSLLHWCSWCWFFCRSHALRRGANVLFYKHCCP